MECESQTDTVLCLLPAGRSELFVQMLAVGDGDKIIELEPPAHLALAAVFEKARRESLDLTWAGDAARDIVTQIRDEAKSAELIFADKATSDASPPRADWTLAAAPPATETLAKHAALLALAHFNCEGATTLPKDLKALYVRLSDAELKEKCHT